MSFQQPKLANPLAPHFAGLKYDPGAYQKEVLEAVGPGRYRLQPYGANCRMCMPVDSHLTAGTAGPAQCDQEPLVDVESDLINIVRPLSYDPRMKYRGNGEGPTVCSKGNLMNQGDCRNMPTADTRLTNPPCSLRGIGINRFEWLCQNPQDRVLIPFDTDVDTALLSKDNHRPFLARPLDPTLSLPPASQVREPMRVEYQKPCFKESPYTGFGPTMMSWVTESQWDAVNKGAR